MTTHLPSPMKTETLPCLAAQNLSPPQKKILPQLKRIGASNNLLKLKAHLQKQMCFFYLTLNILLSNERSDFGAFKTTIFICITSFRRESNSTSRRQKRHSHAKTSSINITSIISLFGKSDAASIAIHAHISVYPITPFLPLGFLHTFIQIPPKALYDTIYAHSLIFVTLPLRSSIRHRKACCKYWTVCLS